MDLGLRALSPKGEQILDQLEADYGVRSRKRLTSGERLYVVTNAGVAHHYERHLSGFDADWTSHVELTIEE
jgi:hypothetical protein